MSNSPSFVCDVITPNMDALGKFIDDQMCSRFVKEYVYEHSEALSKREQWNNLVSLLIVIKKFDQLSW